MEHDLGFPHLFAYVEALRFMREEGAPTALAWLEGLLTRYAQDRVVSRRRQVRAKEVEKVCETAMRKLKRELATRRREEVDDITSRLLEGNTNAKVRAHLNSVRRAAFLVRIGPDYQADVGM